MASVKFKMKFDVLTFGGALLCFLFASCKTSDAAYSSAAPSWVLNPSSVYNSNMYISYVGSGADRDAAQMNALSGIAATFGQSISSVSTATQSFSQSTASGNSASEIYELNRQVEQNVQQAVNQNEMIGVSVNDFWFDGKATWYSLAVINKMEAAGLYEARIANNNTEINTLMKFVESAADKNTFAVYARLAAAAVLAAENDVYIARLSVMSSLRAKDMAASSVSGAAIKNRQREIAENITVAIDVSNDADRSIAAACAEVFSSRGFVTAVKSSYAAKPRYQFTAVHETENTANSTNTILYCRYSLVGYLADVATGEQMMPFSITGREGAANSAEARRRALVSLKKNVSENFGKQFNSFLYSLHE